jgi:hypothetical protein
MAEVVCECGCPRRIESSGYATAPAELWMNPIRLSGDAILRGELAQVIENIWGNR